MNRNIVQHGTGPAPRGYVKCRLGERCSSSEDGPHYHPQSNVERRWVPPHPPDRRPGYYYVSVMDGKKRFFVRGPFETHIEAMRAVEPTKARMEELDPSAFWMTWGTARAETNHGPGTLDRFEELEKVGRKRDRTARRRKRS